MNKQELRGLPQANRDASLIKNYCVGARVLVLESKQLNIPKDIKLSNFFNFIIVTTGLHKAYMDSPDIFVCEDDVDLFSSQDEFFKSENTLFIIGKETAKRMRALKIRPRNYILLSGKNEPSGVDTAQTIAGPSGAVWRADGDLMVPTTGAPVSTEEFFKSTNMYKVPKNILKSNRRLMMEEWS